MDTEMIVLKKRLSTFLTEKGRLRNVSDELLLEILRAWESWTGKAKGFYGGLGVCKQTMANMIKKAKKLSRTGAAGEFREVSVDSILGSAVGPGNPSIELCWDQGKVIRFPNVDQLVDFLRKVA